MPPVAVRSDNHRARRDSNPRKTIKSLLYFSPPVFVAVALLITGRPTPKDRAGALVRPPPLRTSPVITSPADAREGAGEEAKIFKGTGQLVKGQRAGGALPAGAPGPGAPRPAM